MVHALSNPTVRAGGLTFSLKLAYGAAAPGENLALVNGFG